VESVSFLFRLGLVNYQRTNWVPSLPNLSQWSLPKVDYSFRIEKDTWKFWQRITGNKVKICESWGIGKLS
jgi:hypothetical protein